MISKKLKALLDEWDDVRNAISVHHKKHSKVFEIENQLQEELSGLAGQIKTETREFELPMGHKSAELGLGFVCTRKLNTRTMRPSILAAMPEELTAAGILKPPSYAAVNKAVGAGKLSPAALEHVDPPKMDKDLIPGKDYTVTVKFPEIERG